MLRYWEILELPAILARLAEHTSFSAGRELALALRPSTDLNEVRDRQQETKEARHLLDVRPNLGLGGVHDLRPFLKNAVIGARLLPQDLLDIKDTLARVEVLRRALLRLQETVPHLAAIARQLEPQPAIIAEIERCISENGEVLDHASPALGRIRSELKVAHDRLMDKLDRIMSNSRYSQYLQEGYITQRDGRYVIPIKADFKGRMPGLVHDRSASGATFFIEPLATVELNNKWRELQLAEEQEVERILLALSGQVAEQAPTIESTVKALAELDLALAKAKYADAIKATMPEIVPFGKQGARNKGDQLRHPGSAIDLRRARHPLLDPRTVVPIDLRMGDGYFIVVITGPNMGGKTVTLKTVGLLALMAQCGMHLPTEEGSRLTVFEHICADIGDEQSIEQSLSTFSSHMTHIIDILNLANDRSLVLLDELGAGTDPIEGAALAQSLLMHLSLRRVTTLATTHYPELKIFARETPGVINASVEFDVETLAPTYQLTIGLPGHSNAFAIARRLSLPEPIVRRAENLLSDTHLDSERLLAQIKETEAQTTTAHADAEAARSEARQMADELRNKLAEIEGERQSILAETREQAERELEAVRDQLHSAQRRLRLMGERPSELSQLDRDLDALEKELTPFEPAQPRTPNPVRESINVDDTVWVPDLNATGKVLDLDGGAAEVQVGSFRVRTRRASLQLHEKAPPPTSDNANTEVKLPATPAVSLELHLRGMRVEEALEELDRYLDHAYRSQVPFVRIVHGKGQGVLRQAVRQALREHPLVSSFRDGDPGEGDTGVTVVKFVSA